MLDLEIERKGFMIIKLN